MRATRVSEPLATLPEDDDHPYRTGAWTPNLAEWDAHDLEVVEGTIPLDLQGSTCATPRTRCTRRSGCTTRSTATG
jgi:carotenoid cleavage dioxygenase-like enzyme